MPTDIEFWTVIANFGFPALTTIALIFILERKLNGIGRDLREACVRLRDICRVLNVPGRPEE